MQKIEFGSTGLVIEKNGFGCLPIQRISETEAVKLLHKACDGGINFFDTARAYSDSEKKVGAGRALSYNGAPMRGRDWDKRMMADRGDEVVKAVASYVGGKAK